MNTSTAPTSIANTSIANKRNIRTLVAAVIIGSMVTLGATAYGTSTNKGSPSQAPVTPSPATPSQGVTVSTTGRTIVVHGTGRASATPDQATISLGVETNGATAQAALRDNSTKAAELIKLMKSAGVDDKSIQTSQLSIYPRYDDKGQKITGYQVSNMVTVTVKDIKKAGEMLDQAAGLSGDAIRIQGVSFSLSDGSPVMAATQKEARTQAVKDARLQAEQLAEAAGVKIGALRSISNSSYSAPPVMLEQSRAKLAADSSVPLEAGAQQVIAEVDLVFDMA